VSFEFTDAVRQDVALLILLAGGTGSGKTESAMRLATGLSAGKPFAVIDTENGRALHKADDYTFKHATLDAPFSPERYAEAVAAADAAGYPVIVIDSGSHEYEGVGGVLELQSEEFERMGNRDSARMSSWIVPKQRHKRFVQQLLRVRAHVILCLRAEDKIEVTKVDGKTVVRPKESLTGAEGWIPICEKRLPFEATISLLLTADHPGFPKPIKLERRHKELIPLDRELDESVGQALAKWAAGGSTKRGSGETPATGPQPPSTPGDVEAMVATDSPPPLTPSQFKRQCIANVIAPPDIAAAGKALFPGRTANSLDDDERGKLLAHLLAAKDAQQVLT
jgi:AAA domain